MKKTAQDILTSFLFNSKKSSIYLLIIFFGFIVDRITKLKAIETVDTQPIWINNYLNLDLIWNTGIGFGLLNLKSQLIYNFLSIIILIVIFFLIYYLYKTNKTEKYFVSLILSGALGNFYDRIYFRAVPDFIDFHYKDFHWYTFNFADILITIGIILILIKTITTKNV